MPQLVNFLRWGLYLVLLTPLLFQPTSLFPYITVKIVVFQILTTILTAAYLALIIFQPQYRPKFTPLVISFTIFILALLLTGLTGVDWQNSFWSVPERGIGIFTIIHFWLFFLMLVSLRKEIDWQKFLTFSFIISLLAALSAFIFPSDPRPGGVFGNPNFLSPYLLFNVFIGLWLAKNNRWFYLGVLLQILVITLAGSRGVILGLIAGLIILLLLTQKTKLKLAGAGLIIVIIALGLIITRPTAFLSLKSSGIQQRLNNWQIGWQAFKEKPLLGWGWENFNKAYNQYYQPRLLRHNVGERLSSKPHNVFIEYLAAGGLILLLAFLLLMAGAFYKGWLMAGPLLGAYLIQNLFSFDSFGTYLMLAVVLAWIDNHHD